MEEMQRVIQRRGTVGDTVTPRRPVSFHDESPGRYPFERPREDGTASAMNDVAKQLEAEIADALASYEGVQAGLRSAVLRNLEVSPDERYGFHYIQCEGKKTRFRSQKTLRKRGQKPLCRRVSISI
jgi:hypothetical protein